MTMMPSILPILLLPISNINLLIPTYNQLLNSSPQKQHKFICVDDIIDSVGARFLGIVPESKDIALTAIGEELPYDSKGNMVEENSYNKDGSLSSKIIHMYDENGIFITHDKMLKKAIQKAQELQNKGISYRIIECCGTNDCQMTEKTQIQCDTLTQHQDVFSKDKYVMLWIKDASHENRAWDEGLFSALPQFFPGKNYKIKF